MAEVCHPKCAMQCETGVAALRLQREGGPATCAGGNLAETVRKPGAPRGGNLAKTRRKPGGNLADTWRGFIETAQFPWTAVWNRNYPIEPDFKSSDIK